MSKSYRFVIEEENAGKRLDIFLERELNVLGEEVSRSFIHQFLNHALVNDSFRKKNYRLKIHDIITFTRPKLPPLKLIPEEIDFDVIFEDKHLIVVNKPAGLVVHPSRGHQSGTLINGLLNRLGGFKDNDSPLSEEDESHFRPGIVHRLDKDTSGLLVVARDPVTQRKLVSLFQNREVEKHYLALVKGKLPESGKIHEPIARDTRHRKKFTVSPHGKDSLTYFTKIRDYYLNQGHIKVYSKADIRIVTGRTHQIRVHFNHIGHPLLGDPIYSRPREDYESQGLTLCARRLSFRHPVTDELLNFEIEPPSYFKDIERRLIDLSLSKPV